MTETVIVAAAQLDTQDDAEASFARVRALVAEAARRGARVVAFPENVLDETAGRVQDPADWGPRLGALAREHGVALVAGTMHEPSPAGEDRRPFQTALVFDPSGREAFRYRKVHLFDVDIPRGPSERESAFVRPGPVEGVRAFELPPLGTCGLGICYDLRFPELWRRLARAGARTLFVPSSFALGTGKDHWHVLLRARAIEDQAFVVAPAQTGTKPGGRTRYGHAAIVDPWGTVLADAGGEGEGLAVAALDLGLVTRVRTSLPSLANARLEA